MDWRRRQVSQGLNLSKINTLKTVKRGFCQLRSMSFREVGRGQKGSFCWERMVILKESERGDINEVLIKKIPFCAVRKKGEESGELAGCIEGECRTPADPELACERKEWKRRIELKCRVGGDHKPDYQPRSQAAIRRKEKADQRRGGARRVSLTSE